MENGSIKFCIKIIIRKDQFPRMPNHPKQRCSKKTSEMILGMIHRYQPLLIVLSRSRFVYQSKISHPVASLYKMFFKICFNIWSYFTGGSGIQH